MKSTTKHTEIFEDERGYDPELEQLLGSAKCHYWTDNEIATLKRYYGKVNTRKLSEQLGRPYTGVASKAQSLGLKFNKSDE